MSKFGKSQPTSPAPNDGRMYIWAVANECWIPRPASHLDDVVKDLLEWDGEGPSPLWDWPAERPPVEASDAMVIQSLRNRNIFLKRIAQQAVAERNHLLGRPAKTEEADA